MSAERINGGVEWFAIPGRDEEDCQCARCGSSAIFAECESCGGDGEVLDERDWTLGGLIEDYRRCPDCRGTGGWWYCCSGREWCEAHPMSGRESITSTAMPEDINVL